MGAVAVAPRARPASALLDPQPPTAGGIGEDAGFHAPGSGPARGDSAALATSPDGSPMDPAAIAPPRSLTTARAPARPDGRKYPPAPGERLRPRWRACGLRRRSRSLPALPGSPGRPRAGPAARAAAAAAARAAAACSAARDRVASAASANSSSENGGGPSGVSGLRMTSLPLRVDPAGDAVSNELDSPGCRACCRTGVAGSTASAGADAEPRGASRGWVACPASPGDAPRLRLGLKVEAALGALAPPAALPPAAPRAADCPDDDGGVGP